MTEQDFEYQRKRNELISIAEAFANNNSVRKPNKYSAPKEFQIYSAKWNNMFFKKMDQLWKEVKH